MSKTSSSARRELNRQSCCTRPRTADPLERLREQIHSADIIRILSSSLAPAASRRPGLLSWNDDCCGPPRTSRVATQIGTVDRLDPERPSSWHSLFPRGASPLPAQKIQSGPYHNHPPRPPDLTQPPVHTRDSGRACHASRNRRSGNGRPGVADANGQSPIERSPRPARATPQREPRYWRAENSRPRSTRAPPQRPPTAAAAGGALFD